MSASFVSFCAAQRPATPNTAAAPITKSELRFILLSPCSVSIGDSARTYATGNTLPIFDQPPGTVNTARLHHRDSTDLFWWTLQKLHSRQIRSGKAAAKVPNP